MRKPLSELISEAIQHRIHGNRDSVEPLLPNLSLARLDVGHTHAFRPMFSDYRPARLQGWPPISRSKSMGRYPPQQGGALEYCGTITTLMLFPAFCSLSAMTGSKVWLLSDKLDPSHQLHVFSIQALQIIIPNHKGQYIGKLIAEYMAYVRSRALDGSSNLSRFKLA
jgi:hypothetical protein